MLSSNFAVLGGNVLPTPTGHSASGVWRGVLASWGIDRKSLIFGGSRLSTARPRGVFVCYHRSLNGRARAFSGGERVRKPPVRIIHTLHFAVLGGNALLPNEAKKANAPAAHPHPARHHSLIRRCS